MGRASEHIDKVSVSLCTKRLCCLPPLPQSVCRASFPNLSSLSPSDVSRGSCPGLFIAGAFVSHRPADIHISIMFQQLALSETFIFLRYQSGFHLLCWSHLGFHLLKCLKGTQINFAIANESLFIGSPGYIEVK